MALQQEKISIIASSQTHGTKSKTAVAEQPKGARSPRTCSPKEGCPKENFLLQDHTGQDFFPKLCG